MILDDLFVKGACKFKIKDKYIKALPPLYLPIFLTAVHPALLNYFHFVLFIEYDQFAAMPTAVNFAQLSCYE